MRVRPGELDHLPGEVAGFVEQPMFLERRRRCSDVRQELLRVVPVAREGDGSPVVREGSLDIAPSLSDRPSVTPHSGFHVAR
jgi:hypothetical protein